MALPVWVTAILLFVFLINSSEGHPEVESAPLPCDTNQFYDLDSCCKTPQFFPAHLVQHCINEIGNANSNENATDFSTADEDTEEIKPFLTGAGGPMLAVDCIFRNQSLLKESGYVDVEKVERLFRKSSDESWYPLLKLTISQCELKLKELNTSVVEEKQYSNVGPGFFMSCMRSLLILNCPDSIKANADAICTEKFAAVKRCGPFELGSGEMGGAGGWMRGLLRWLVGSKQNWGEESIKSTGKKPFFFHRLGMIFPFGK